ncbi:MAG TPA: hypothetical protein VH352_02780 [Pseudonocardiaceae bacterium]|nr:hypothetical protein [Pseudonocardiaceae bacterium]
MSAGGILIVPGAVVAAAGVVVVLTAAAAAVLVVHAASAAAERAVRALGDYGERLEMVAAAQQDAEVRSLLWDAVAADVVELNARIRMLVERASRAKVPVAVPKPLILNGCGAADAVAWCVRAAQSLRSAQETLHAAVTVNEGQRVAAALPQAVVARPDTTAALARFQDTLRERYAVESTPDVPPIDSAAAVEPALRALDPDANERERAEVLCAAALVATNDPRAVTAYLRALRTKVGTVNDAVARRRLAAQWLSALEDQIVVGTDLPQPFLDTAAKLRSVVTGDADLTPEVRAEGAEAVAWAAETTRQHFVRDMMHGCLAELGYSVDVDFDLQHSTELRLTRPTWHGEHSAAIWVDQHGTVHGRLVREHSGGGDEATMREQARCTEFNADLKALGDQLRADVDTDDGYVPQRRNSATANAHAIEPRYREHR